MIQRRHPTPYQTTSLRIVRDEAMGAVMVRVVDIATGETMHETPSLLTTGIAALPPETYGVSLDLAA